MHFVCQTFGSGGDVYPMLGLALELRQRGHRVTLATNGHFASLAADYDMPFYSLGTEADYQACINHPDLWHPQKSFRHVFRNLEPILRTQYAMLETFAQKGPLVSLTSCFGFGALLAREILKLPTITVHLQPAVLWSDYDPPALAGVKGPRWFKSLMFRIGERFFLDPVVCPFLNAWRKELGLPPVRQVARYWHSPDGVLCLFPEWFAPPQRDWPQPLLQADFPLWNPGSEQALPATVDLFLKQGAAPVIFTPGTANCHGRRFFEAAIEACRALGRRAILLTRFADQLPPLPHDVLHATYVPLDRLLPHAAAFVHHGGIGSTAQGLTAGVPQLIMPLAHDQFDNAQRIIRLGVGLSLPATKFTAKRLIPRLQQLLDQPQVTKQCRDVACKIQPSRGLRMAADLVEAQLK
ncbi:glycosyltransferase [bacterium]|nr:glycosyltransferase [bacterium]